MRCSETWARSDFACSRHPWRPSHVGFGAAPETWGDNAEACLFVPRWFKYIQMIHGYIYYMIHDDFMMISWWFHDDFIGLSRLPSYEVDTARYDCYAIHVPHCACILWFCLKWLACSSGGLGCGRSIWFFEASNLAKITFALRDTVTVRRREVSRKWFLTKNMFALAQGNIQKVLFLVVGSSQAF